MNKNNKFQILTTKSTEIEKIQFSKLYKTGTEITKSLVKYNGKEFLIKTPPLVLGSDIIKCGDEYYIDLIIGENKMCNQTKKSKRSNDFLELIKNIDYLVISEIYENGQSWYQQNTDPSLIQIERDFIPTIKLSTINDSLQSMKFKVNANNVEFFDYDNESVSYQLLKKGYRSNALLKLSQIYKQGDHLWIDWQILQLKTEIPQQMLNGCHLTDVNLSIDEDEETVCDDESDY